MNKEDEASSKANSEDASVNNDGSRVKENLEKSEVSFSIGDELGTFVERINSLSEIFPVSTSVIAEALTRTTDETMDFIDKHTETIKMGETEHKVVMDDYRREFLRLTRKVIRVGLAREVVPRSFIVSLVSQFDFFLGQLVRAFFFIKPDALNASEKLLSFSQILDFGSIENAREYIIEKEVETVLRQNHTEQFQWFENKLALALRKELDAWPTFIEVTERRNLFVHANGVFLVSI